MPQTSRIAFLLLTATLSTARAASAQQPDTVRPIDLPGVTVTVTRSTLPLQRTPHAVSVAEGDAVGGGRPGLGLDEAMRAIPGVQIDNRYGVAILESEIVGLVPQAALLAAAEYYLQIADFSPRVVLENRLKDE